MLASTTRPATRLKPELIKLSFSRNGTDSPLFGLTMADKSFMKVTGKRVTFEHVFACDNDSFSQVSSFIPLKLQASGN